MPNKRSLESKFVAILEANHLERTSKIFNLGDRLYLPDFVFNDLIVEVSEEVTARKIDTIKEFKHSSPSYRIVLLTDGDDKVIDGATHFDESFDLGSIKVLLSEIKKSLRGKSK